MKISKQALLPFAATAIGWFIYFIYESIRLANISQNLGKLFPSHDGRSWLSYYFEEFTKPLSSTWWMPVCGMAFSYLLYFLENQKKQ